VHRGVSGLDRSRYGHAVRTIRESWSWISRITHCRETGDLCLEIGLVQESGHCKSCAATIGKAFDCCFDLTEARCIPVTTSLEPQIGPEAKSAVRKLFDILTKKRHNFLASLHEDPT
jgi:hypothetical protein